MFNRRAIWFVAACLVASPVYSQLTTRRPPPAATFSSVMFDLGGNGLNLSGSARTALVTGTAQQYRWTTANTDDAFLLVNATSLRNTGFAIVRPNGTVADGYMLFVDGLAIKSPDGSTAVISDAWQALLRLDGNGDGQINRSDQVFSHLFLFVDANADGNIAGGELSSLPSRGVASIQTTGGSGARTDSFGNKLRDSTFTRSNGTSGTMSDVNFGPV